MFDNIFKNGKFLPFNEDKLKSRLTTDDALLLTDGVDFKLNVYQIVNGYLLKDFECQCGNYVSFKTAKKGLGGFCSKSCATKFNSSERIEKRNLKFGTKEKYSEYMSKVQLENSIKKYGTSHQKASRNKNKETLLEKYGVDHNSKLDSVKESRKIMDDGLLVDAMQTKKSILKATITRNSKLLEEKKLIYKKAYTTRKTNSNIDYKFLDAINSKLSIEEVEKISGCSRMTAYRVLDKAGFMNKKYTQNSILEFVASLGFECYETRKIIPPYELDVYIPERNLAIEYNGLYWHSSNSKETDQEKSNYHLMKTDMCEAKGIQLLHIFENEWIDLGKREIWKSVIKHKLGLSEKIMARKCTISTVPQKDAKTFIECNHLQGFCSGAHTYKGLYYNNELVQIVSIGKSRYSSGDELLRMCSKLGYCVIGGASRLLKNTNLVSYGNRRWCSTISNVYDKVLKYSHKSAPCYWYINKGQLFHRSNFMKHKLANKLNTFDDTMTEVENCYKNGLRRIWDCGNLVYRN
ncbi:hypothetical protein BN80_236 [Yersinia phage phiR1-RT]|uniref:Hef-like homing endonuclease n=1 Tax=Yersinia phage phiR1-RT TaxID=1206558 RepID=I7K3A8_BPPR1|nr:homing endonuclease [Yersinia phage phiR1-RT]CCI88806.1 hypothetical protein BN80_236 [Yersinia phage phiR1-RT]